MILAKKAPKSKTSKKSEVIRSKSPTREIVPRAKTHVIRRPYSFNDERMDNDLDNSSFQRSFSGNEDTYSDLKEPTLNDLTKKLPVNAAASREKLHSKNNVDHNRLSQNESYSQILHTSAEKVLSKLKTRQRHLSEVSDPQQSNKARAKRQYQPVAPRKLEPLFPNDQFPSEPEKNEKCAQLPKTHA